ncbi:MAG: Uma2 family endonuclease [Planctomycetia bacterium]|nr:Uma2 family endonuclease [Planctomycetia bacterium]
MNTIVADTATVRVPVALTTLTAFRSWIQSDGVSEETRAYFLNGEVWIDMSREQLFSHNQVKGEVTRVLGGIAKSDRSGLYLPDGMLFSNPAANLSAQPDGAYFSYESEREGRVLLVEGAKHGIVELEGTLDMVVEIVSDSSVEKDKKILPDLYYRAGVREYWVIDARAGRIEFDIMDRGATCFDSNISPDGWVDSEVFGRRFRLSVQTDPLGHPAYLLESRDS